MWADNSTLKLLEKAYVLLKVLLIALGLFAVGNFVLALFALWTAPPTLPYFPCFPTGPISPATAALLLEPLKEGRPYRCSSQDTAVEQPCVCCVTGHCWRNAEIIYNRSRTATVVDYVNGRTDMRLRRELPYEAHVCFHEVSAKERNCTDVSGRELSYVLRALEMRNGWPPAGSPDYSKKSDL